VGSLQKGNLESLLEKAKELENKYEWLQAAENYRKAAELVLTKKDILKAADLNERIGFCYYRASLQAQSNAEFRRILKFSILAYEKESEFLKGIETEELQLKRIHADALTSYAKSWYKTNPKTIKKLCNKWWTLENKLLRAHESAGDLHSVGRTCNDLLEYSTFDRYWLASNFLEHKEMYEESLLLAEKAIKIFSSLDDKYELSRAYLSICWYYGMIEGFEEDENKLIQISHRCKDMANKALELSQEIGDAWLISRSYQAAWGVAQNLKGEFPIAIELGEKMLEYGRVAKDNYLLGFGNCLTSASIIARASHLEDPDEQKELCEKALKMSQKATHNFQIINNIGGFQVSYTTHMWQLAKLALIETDPKKKQKLFEKAIKVGQEGLKQLKGWKRLYGILFAILSQMFLSLSSTKRIIEEKKELLRKAQSFATKYSAYAQEMEMPASTVLRKNKINSLIQMELANIEPNVTKKINLLTKALISSERSIYALKKKEKFYSQSGWGVGVLFGKNYDKLGRILQQIYSLSEKKENLYRAIEAYKQAAIYYKKADLPTHIAESCWHLAQLHDQAGEFQEASKNYESASQAYDLASKKIPQLKDFYKEHSLYMQAWNQIEQARYCHSIENYEEAHQNYKRAARLHESTSSWNYLAPNYHAWANMEEAESLSRNEHTELAMQTFQKALQQFNRAEESIKEKLEKISSEEEKEITQLLKASEFRQKYCQARILMESAKLLDRDGKHLQSSKSYEEAAKKISTIFDKIDVETERKELEYIAILCQAWEKMANAEETTSSEFYLDAAELFERAKEHCYTKKASFWALGNSYFCKGLAAQNQFQKTLDRSYHSKANKYIKQAANYYKQAGYKKASEYARATQRLFDAYLYMNSAEDEIDPEKKTKYYQLAEQLLQIAANSFSKAQQADKTTQVQSILSTVREEKALAASLNAVMQAPTIASTTQSFLAPTTTNEVSVGLEQFEHANVQATLITNISEVKVSESFCLSIEFVNAGREPALLLRVEDFLLPEFVVVKKPEIYHLEETTLNMKGKQLAPLKLVEVKLTLQPSKKGNYKLNPRVHYLDELGKNKSLQLKTLEIKVEEVLLEDRVSTGTQELDSLLLGGIPGEYAVILTGSPSDERERLIQNFLEAGIKDYEIVFDISTEADGLEYLLEKSNFHLFLCNPKPKTQVPDLSNIYKLRSKTDLTNLSISLAKTYRTIDQSKKKRICIETVSDVLVDYETKATRKWISELITDLGSKGFTMLAVINPDIHPHDQARAIIDLFDGEISLTQTEDPLECRKSVRVKKLRNQDYIKNPICLT
jgi:KaiC/GvpD/RAD55 family RecA-like ATPase/tetratricopeptide (TPR) repeat protein